MNDKTSKILKEAVRSLQNLEHTTTVPALSAGLEIFETFPQMMKAAGSLEEPYKSIGLLYTLIVDLQTHAYHWAILTGVTPEYFETLSETLISQLLKDEALNSGETLKKLYITLAQMPVTQKHNTEDIINIETLKEAAEERLEFCVYKENSLQLFDNNSIM